eukprot:CAMPEP_0119074642 /NCGR_PEP_ID=MMETSP1178-20130426/72240_1 /TAXON_ID=33656 /ORGANISM="unid sp, Strain CCMP2000" /LENGTH=187 /DNA_ID=CAMNT_0007056811 /DNA_START=188 /DNA_END=749 /DNA_ORIENTATION=-
MSAQRILALAHVVAVTRWFSLSTSLSLDTLTTGSSSYGLPEGVKKRPGNDRAAPPSAGHGGVAAAAPRARARSYLVVCWQGVAAPQWRGVAASLARKTLLQSAEALSAERAGIMSCRPAAEAVVAEGVTADRRAGCRLVHALHAQRARVVHLGGGHTPSSSRTNLVADARLARLARGVKLQRLKPVP